MHHHTTLQTNWIGRRVGSDQGLWPLTFDMTAPAIHDKGIAVFSDIEERIPRHAFAPQAAEACICFNEAGAISVPALHEPSFRW